MGAPRTSRRRKRFGQHFLTDGRVADRIVGFAELQPSDHVLEIGPGHGVLTKRIAGRVARLVAIELDPRFVEELERQGLREKGVEVVRGDATDFDYASLGRIDKIVANLPYAASSPITFRLLGLPFARAVLMYQREFAERLTAPRGSPDYGRLAAHASYYVATRILEIVPRTAFTPPPEVESAVVLLTPHPRPPFPVGSPATFDALLRVLFSTRRKTIRATLRRHHDELGLPDWTAVEGIVTRSKVADRRPEELSPAELGALDRALMDARRG